MLVEDSEADRTFATLCKVRDVWDIYVQPMYVMIHDTLELYVHTWYTDLASMQSWLAYGTRPKEEINPLLHITTTPPPPPTTQAKPGKLTLPEFGAYILSVLKAGSSSEVSKCRYACVCVGVRTRTGENIPR